MDTLKYQLQKLESEHHDLDIAIEKLSNDTNHDQLALQRMKRRKLQLKDEIKTVRTRLLPDIIA